MVGRVLMELQVSQDRDPGQVDTWGLPRKGNSQYQTSGSSTKLLRDLETRLPKCNKERVRYTLLGSDKYRMV